MTARERYEALNTVRADPATVHSVMLFDDIGRTDRAGVEATAGTGSVSGRADEVARDVLAAITTWPTPGLTVLVFATGSPAAARHGARLPHIRLPAPTTDSAGAFLRRHRVLLGSRTELADFAPTAVARDASYGDLESLARNVRQLELLLPNPLATGAVQKLLEDWQPRHRTARAREERLAG